MQRNVAQCDRPSQAGGRVQPSGRSNLATVLLAAGGAVFWVQLGAEFLGRHASFWASEDFTVFYVAGRLVAEGAGSFLYHPAVVGAVERAVAGGPVGGSGSLAYFNPPFFALLFLPLTELPLKQAFQAWTLFNIALVAITTWQLWQLAAPLDRRWRVILTVGFLSFYPVAYGLRLGQFSLLLTAGSAGAYLFLRQRRERLAGFALALLLIKPELLLPPVAFFAWKRRWRVLQGLLPMMGIAIIISVRIVGWQEAVRYPSYLLHSTTWQDNGVGTPMMFGWNGLLAVAWRHGPAQVELIGATVLALVGLAAAAIAWRGELRWRSQHFAAQWLWLTLATLLADPHLYIQDTVVAVPAVVAFLARSGRHGQRIAAAGLVVGWLVLLGYGIVVYEVGGQRAESALRLDASRPAISGGQPLTRAP